VKVVVDKKRVDGTRVRLAEVEVGDETGIVSLRARDDQIDILKDVSERSGAAVLRNCTLELYQGRHLRLAVTKWGKLSPYPDQIASTPPPPSKINRDRNFSLIDLSLVASEMVAFVQEDPFHQPPTEVENQASSVTNRQQPQQLYHNANQSASRRGRRVSSQSSKGGGGGGGGSGYQRQQQQQQQQQQQTQRRYTPATPKDYGVGFSYQGAPGMHGHGYSGMDSAPYPYATSQQEKMSTPLQHHQQHQHHHQQLMFQQQYEMQQRQMQQMYSGSQDQSLATGSMVSPGVIHPTSSFDTHTSYASSPSSAPAVPTSSPFLVAAQQGILHSSSSHGDSSLHLNPQAATFDPRTQQMPFHK